MLGIQVVNQIKWPTYHTRPSLCVHRKHTNLRYWEPVATGNLVCYLVFGYCGNGWKWLHGNGILTETKFVCQSVTAMLGCRKYKLSILLLKGSRALPGVDNGCIYSGVKISLQKVFLLLYLHWQQHPTGVVLARPLFFSQLVKNNLYHVHRWVTFVCNNFIALVSQLKSTT